ncbi:MAG TPA: S8 family serine peptidase [Nitriliruptorales bacterium]|nr:S8 family serine peptidase [Nitriliruptorales bacterium]
MRLVTSARLPLALGIVAALLVGLLAFPSGQGPGEDRGGRAVPGTLLMTTGHGGDLPAVLEHAPRALSQRGVEQRTMARIADRVAMVKVAPNHQVAAEQVLRALPGVIAVEADRFASRMAVPNDPYYSRQWAHGQTRAPGGWDVQTGRDVTRVAVIDTGVRGDHPDLRGNVDAQVDISTGRPAGPPRQGVDNDSCGVGHGTWVAGVLGAVGNNGSDVAGVAWDVAITDIAVNSTRPGAYCDAIPFSAVIAGIDYAVSDPVGRADVINLSLGAYMDRCPTSLQSAIDEAHAAGSLVVAAAGNGQSDPSTAGATAMPAGCQRVLGVGATGPTKQRAGYSQINAAVDLVAPGGDYEAGGADALVLTTNHALELGRLALVQGTSFSAPYVAGVAGLMRAHQPAASPDQVAGVLTGTAEDLGPAGRDDAYGSGLVRTDAALRTMAGSTPRPASPSPHATTSPSPSPSPSPTATTPAPPPGTERVAASRDTTRPVSQAVAVSRLLFADGSARHAILARHDQFPDALAGSALGFGVGPLLFAEPVGALPAATRQELRRVLPEGRRVYLLGGSGALPTALDSEVRALGYQPVRLAGPSREETAAAIAREVRRRLPELGGHAPRSAVLATRGNWPDAVTAGSLGAAFGIPILLTSPSQLHPATQQVIAELDLDLLFVAGGPVAVDEPTAGTAGAAAGAQVIRLAGPTRVETALAISEEAERQLRARDTVPRFAIAVNVRRADGWAHVLSASAITGARSGVFVPVEGDGGASLTDTTQQFLRGRWTGEQRVLGLVVGGRDLVADGTAQRLEELLSR